MSILRNFLNEVDGMIVRDPAARSRLEVILCYPSLHAVIAYRMAHWLWKRNWRLLPRMISQLARWLTGIEIHPGARIGKNLFIDHAMGVVIGETAEIGDNVTLYHDVTLGGVSPAEESEKQRSVKRHPTLEDDVIVGCGAQILGPITVGKCARVGANSVVVKDVASRTTVVGVPAKVVMARSKAQETVFSPYGTPLGDMPDPVAKAIDGLMQEISGLRAELRVMEDRLSEAESRNPLPGDGEPDDKPDFGIKF